MMLIAVVCLGILYAALVFIFTLGWHKLPLFWHKGASGVGFSIIVPFRNEEKNLKALIAHLKKLHYPAKDYEVIFVNDQSTDNGARLVQTAIEKSLYPAMQLLHVPPREGYVGKKGALQVGISKARFEYIITLDADCVMGSHWLQTYATFIASNPADMIIGPVEMISDGTLKSDYFALEFYSLLGATMGASAMRIPVMCNGANLVFRKETFERVGGFQGNMQYASGDDVFLLHKFKKQEGVIIQAIKSPGALAYTKTPETVKHFIRQRVRWSAKGVGYTDFAAKALGGVVAAFNIAIVASFLGGLLSFQLIPIALGALTAKAIIDFPLIWVVAEFLRKKHLLWLYPSLAIMYPFYVTLTLALSVLPARRWK